jgi:hypothetical protein
MRHHTKIIRFVKLDNERAKRPAVFLVALLSPILLAAVLPVIVHAIRESLVPGFYVICPFLIFTGIPCPFCGLTRSLLCLMHGEITQAFWYHPLGPVAWGGAVLLVTCTLSSLMFERSLTLKISRRWKAISLLAIVFLVWAGNVFLGHH